jgi:hypothetical protein
MVRIAGKFTARTCALLLLAGCGGESGGTGQVAVQLTDAPIENVQSATVWVSSVYLIGGSDSTGARFTVLSTPQQYDLLTLTNGATAALGVATIPIGNYTQLRFVVDSARITLKAGKTFSDGSSSKTLQTPSAQRTGIKVDFSGPVNIVPGQTILVVDFDMARNFVFTGPSASPTGVLFTPVLHATVRDIAGSIAGTVTPANAKARLYAILNGDTITSALADSLTGVYKLWFLPPGSYSVAAVATGFQTQTASAAVADAQNVTGLNFALTP